MKKRMLVMVLFVFALFSGSGLVMAHGSGSMGNMQGNSMQGMDMSGKDKNMDMSGKDKNMDMGSTNQQKDMQGMNMAGDSHSSAAVKEKPANLKILGTYGAVNLSFIVIGIWNKWFRREDESDGNTKQQTGQ